MYTVTQWRRGGECQMYEKKWLRFWHTNGSSRVGFCQQGRQLQQQQPQHVLGAAEVIAGAPHHAGHHYPDVFDHATVGGGGGSSEEMHRPASYMVMPHIPCYIVIFYSLKFPNDPNSPKRMECL